MITVSGMAERVAALRAAQNLSLRELASAAGIAYSELVRLEGRAPRVPNPDLVKRLARFFRTTERYLLEGAEPAPAEIRAGFFRCCQALSPERREALKYAPIQARIALMLQYLEEAFPTLLSRSQTAPRLGYSHSALDDLLRGAAPVKSHLLGLLTDLSGVGANFFVRGDLVEDAEGQRSIDPQLLEEYYQVVQEAIAAGISPEALRAAVRRLTGSEGDS